jgi:glucosamine--fructose-6-phosphate aminotransferase (isomerizing)
LPQALEQIMVLDDAVQQAVARYRTMEHCVVIGRGYNYATAFEIALKIKELTYVLAQPYSSADFLHGPIAVVTEGFPAIVIAPQGRTYEDVRRLIHSLQEKAAEMTIISDQDEVLSYAKTPLRLPVTVEEWLSPIACVVPGQLVACRLAQTKGYDPDHPRGLLKVTQTF